jgi:hypothetical protein
MTQVVEPDVETEADSLQSWDPDFLPKPGAWDMPIGVETAGPSGVVLAGGAPHGSVHRAGVFAVTATTFASPVTRQRAV